MARRVQIGARLFHTRKAAVEHFRDILNRTQFREVVSAEAHADLLALLNVHPDAQEKIGAGVTCFFVDTSPEHPTRCFWIRRTDGSEIDFSYMSALDAAR